MADDDALAKLRAMAQPGGSLDTGDPLAKLRKMGSEPPTAGPTPGSADDPLANAFPPEGNIGTSLVAPIANTALYPARAIEATGYGLIKGGLPTDEKSRASYNAAREEALKSTEIPESETGRAISGALAMPGQMVGAGVKDVSERVLGADTTAAIGPYATMVSDAAPIGGGMAAALRGRNPATLPRASAEAARTAGYRLPPEEIMARPSPLAQFGSGWSGKYKKQQAFSEINSENTNALAARAIGLPPDTTLSEAAFDQARAPAIAAYDGIKTAHPNTVLAADPSYVQAVQSVGVRNAAVEKFFPKTAHNPRIQELQGELLRNNIADTDAVMKQIAEYRFEAKQNFKKRDDAQAHALGFAQRQAADVLEDAIERSIGYGPQRVALFDAYGQAQAMPGIGASAITKQRQVAQTKQALMQSLATVTPAERAAAAQAIEQYQAARQRFARVSDVELATRPDGTVVANRIKALQTAQKRPLSGELKQIADTAQNFPKEMQDPATFGRAESLSVLDIIGAGTSLVAGHPEAAGLFLGRPLARSMLTSRLGQNRMFNRTPITNSPAKATLAGEVLQPRDTGEYDPLADAMR